MKKFILFCGVALTLSITSCGFSHSTTEDVKDNQKLVEPLRLRLFEKIKNHKVISYKQVWKAFKTTDPLPGHPDEVFDIYSYNDKNSPKMAYVYKFFVDQCGAYKKEGDCYNREHSFPKAWWGGGLGKPMARDLFHIYPTDGFVNNMRSNYPYAEVDRTKEGSYKRSSNGSFLGKSKNTLPKGRVFEPVKEFKGDLARGYFYLLTAYYDRVKNWSSPMLKGDNFTPWAQEMLLRWHKEDPVSKKETERNAQIKAIQGNYNPFIENPEFVEQIWNNN
ncbi:MAG: hypothetical protein FE834_04885 [Gammaproteobacteria bacterium]|nr:hypothetical protein [Gammaproteobacteria bacterium]